MNCKNCQTELTPKGDFCPNCGAKVIRKRLTLINIFRHFTETFFSYDNTFFKTFYHLLFKPERVIISYINGVRKRYIAPLSFFAIAISLSGLYLFVIRKYVPEILDMMLNSYEVIDANSATAGRKATDFAMEYNSLLNFVFIPFLALLSRLVFLKNKLNFTEHLVIYFYTISLISMVSVVLTILIVVFFSVPFVKFTILLYAFMLLYHCFTLYRVFALSFKQLMIKIFIFLPLFLLFYIIFSIVIAFIFFLTGVFNPEDFAPKP